MKYKNMRKKLLPLNLQFFAESGDEDSSTSAGGDDPDEDEDSDEDGEDDSEEKKYSEKDMEAAIEKRLARERRKWKRENSQLSTKHNKVNNSNLGSEQKDVENEASKALLAEEKAAALELKWTCLEHDVRKDCVDDVLALAKVHTQKDSSVDIEDAIDKVLEKYPQFKDGYEPDDSDTDENEKQKSWGQRHNKPPKKASTVDDEIRKQLFGK